MPALAAVSGLEERSVFDPGVDDVGIVGRRLEVPDALELPRMLRAVVPLVSGERLARLFAGVVGKPVAWLGRPALRFLTWLYARLKPGLSAVVGALHNL